MFHPTYFVPVISSFKLNLPASSRRVAGLAISVIEAFTPSIEDACSMHKNEELYGPDRLWIGKGVS